MTRERFLVASLGSVKVGFDVALVAEVLPMSAVARVPWAPSFACGVMNHQGRLITLVDLALFLEQNEPAPPTLAVLIDRAELSLALAVSSVAIVEAKDAVRVSQIKQFLPQASWITEALSTPELSFQHLDLARVLSAIEEAF